MIKEIKLDRDSIELAGDAVTLRPYHRADVAALYMAVKESLKEMGPWLPFAHANYSLKETRQWIKQRPREWKKGITCDFAIIDAKDGVLIGGCGLNGIAWQEGHANLGYWVRTSRTGHGVAPAAARLLAKWGFDALKLSRIEIVVAVENQRSLRVAEKVGARREGVLRNRLKIGDVLHDAVMHSLLPGEI